VTIAHPTGYAAAESSPITAAAMGATPDPAGVQFGRNLRRLRSLAGLSQAELGRRLGVSFQQVL
jgi:hypothetical protein